MTHAARYLALGALTALAIASLSASGQSAAVPSATLCVKPHGASGCYSSIQAAVDAAAPYDTIRVYNGTYAEGVIVGKPLALIGENPTRTIIDAKKQSNGIFIDGLDHPGLNNVKVSRLTVMKANFEGIVAVNASHVEIRDTIVLRNDRALDAQHASCPGLPSWETDEHFDCGEGIHLSGVDHATVAGNLSEYNSGGILISDDTAKVHDNVIINNVARQNPYDCGIVLASHPPAPNSTAPHYGVVNNMVGGNESTRNGYKQPGEGAGVGMFSDGTGPGRVSGTTVVNNVLLNNGLPGVILQSHANFDDMSGNAIVGNTLAGNGSLGAPATTGISVYSPLGRSHMSDTVISGNVISNEQTDVEFDLLERIALHNNSLLGGLVGVLNYGKGTVDATYNWWGCAAGPGSPGCSSAQGARIRVKPWLGKPPRR